MDRRQREQRERKERKNSEEVKTCIHEPVRSQKPVR